MRNEFIDRGKMRYACVRLRASEMSATPTKRASSSDEQRVSKLISCVDVTDSIALIEQFYIYSVRIKRNSDF